jgi:aspartate kinase
MIVQSHDSHADRASLTFTVPKDQVEAAVAVARQLADEFSCGGVSSSPDIAKLSVSGVGLRSHTGVAIRTFQALADAGVNVDMISTSEVRFNVVVDGAEGQTALDRLKATFADALH